MAAPTSGEGLTRAQFSVALRLVALTQVLFFATLHVVGGSVHVYFESQVGEPRSDVAACTRCIATVLEAYKSAVQVTIASACQQSHISYNVSAKSTALC